jgi:hypothetical protein
MTQAHPRSKTSKRQRTACNRMVILSPSFGSIGFAMELARGCSSGLLTNGPTPAQQGPHSRTREPVCPIFGRPIPSRKSRERALVLAYYRPVCQRDQDKNTAKPENASLRRHFQQRRSREGVPGSSRPDVRAGGSWRYHPRAPVRIKGPHAGSRRPPHAARSGISEPGPA